jgi:deazaflavin-dependent oxidoreductase (nitroreductase family)
VDGRQALADFGFRTMNQLHRSILRATGGRVLSRPFGMPVVELTTVGRRSGRRRTTMLTAPVVDGERVVLVASKGGDDRDPDWFRNLLANPEVELTLEGRTRQMMARRATPEEKATLWPQVVAAYKGYGGYQARTQRDIPVVVCDPA